MPQNSQDFFDIFLENISRSIGESIHGDGGRRNRPRPSPQPCKSSADPARSRTLLQRSRYRATECKDVISSILRRKVANPAGNCAFNGLPRTFVLLKGSFAHKGLFHAGKLRSVLVFVTECGIRRVSTRPGKRACKHGGVRIYPGSLLLDCPLSGT
jgi:hypothetical protein